MKSETLLEVVNELIGYTEPYGDTRVDEIRYENQEKLIELVTNGVEELIKNSKYADKSEYSMCQIGNRAFDVLEELYDMIKYAINK